MNISFGTSSVHTYKKIEHYPQKTIQNMMSIQKDKITIGSRARELFGQKQQMKNNLIEGLMQQRENIQKMKHDLTEQTLNKGDSLRSIKDRLNEFDKQIEEINKQISEHTIEDLQKSLGKKEDSERTQTIKPADEEDLMTSFLQTTHAFDRLQQLSRVRGNLEREHSVLANQIQKDASRGTFIQSKTKKLNELESRIKNTEKLTMEKMISINKPIDTSKLEKASKDDQESTSDQNQNEQDIDK